LRSTPIRRKEWNLALLGCYAAGSGKFLPTFRDNLSVLSLGVMNPKSRKVISSYSRNISPHIIRRYTTFPFDNVL